MPIARVVDHRMLSPEARAENRRISAEAIELARAADAAGSNDAVAAVLAEIEALGGLSALSARDYDRMWRRLTTAMRQRRG
jgi:hypothetical protein